MDRRPIGFLDSGIGGIPYLMWARSALPKESFVYCADSERFPYGEEESESIRQRIIEVVGQLISEHDPKVIVVACNTASVVALSSLRDVYPIPFVGVVPAVKPAAQEADGKPIALLATSRTVADDYTKRLIDAYASHCRVIRYADHSLVASIERLGGNCSHPDVQRTIHTLAGRMIDDHIGQLVLGCTHFVFCAGEFAEVLGSAVKIIDSREGVTNQLIRIIERDNLTVEKSDKSISTLVETSHDQRLKAVAQTYGLTYGGIL